MPRTIPALATVFLICLQLSLNAQYEWRHRACIPVTAPVAATFSVGNMGYVILQHFGSALPNNEVWKYDPSTDAWVQKNNYPGEASGSGAFVINDTAYAGLGIDTLGVYHADFWRYDAAGDNWIRVADFPGAPRYTAMTFAINGKGYVGCGHGAGENNDFYQYDPALNVWVQKASFPGAARQSGIGIAMGGMGYMGLGWGSGILHPDIYKYDPVNDAWSSIANLDNMGRTFCSCFALNDTFYIAGGANMVNSGGLNLNALADCWRYDTAGNTWIQEPRFSCLLPGLVTAINGTFTINAHVYVCGGATPAVFLNTLLEFGPHDNSFIQRVHILGGDATYCNNFSRVLSTGDSCAEWSTGARAGQITVSTPGTYWVRFNDSCGVSTDTVTITLSNLQLAVSLVNAGCSSHNGSVTISALSGTPPFRYLWSNSDTSEMISNLAAGIYSVTVNDANGCSTTAAAIVDSSGTGQVAITAYRTVFCSNDSVRVCAPAGFNVYQWNTGQTSNCIYAKTAGNYYVTVSDNNGCSAESNHLALSVFQQTPVSVSQNGDTLIVQNAANVQWYQGGRPIPGASNSIYIINEPGDYTVETIDTNGCTVSSNPIRYTGIGNVAGDKIQVFPNPTVDGIWQVNVSSDLIGSTLEIIDDNGRLVYRNSIFNTNTGVEINLAKGIYWMRIYSSKEYVVRKLVKE